MPLSRRATAGKRSTNTRAHTGDTTVERRDSSRGSRRRTSFVAQEQGGGEEPPQGGGFSRSTAARTRPVSPRRGGRSKGGNNNVMLYAVIGGVALLIVIAIAASSGSGASPRPSRARPAPAPAAGAPAAAAAPASSRAKLTPKKKSSSDAPPPDFKGAPKLNKFEDDKWSKTHKDTSVKNDLSKAEVDSRIAEARKLMKQVDATRKSEDRNALRRQVDALCNEAINSRNATEADRKAAQQIKWAAGKSQGVK